MPSAPPSAAIAATMAPTIARLLLPRPALAGCVRGLMLRDTRGVVLSDAQRYNHFPATPLCSLVWYLDGDAHGLPPGQPAHADTPRVPMPSRVLFFGPFTGPMVSHNPGAVRSLVLLLMPDALHALTGLAVADWLDRYAPLADVLDADWQALGAAVLAQQDDTRWLALIDDFLLPRWTALRPTEPPAVQRYRDWTQALALRAATSAPGRSLRQVERRLRQWAGQPLRELQVLARSEQAFLQAMAASAQGPVRLADLAADTGFADQSHMGRVTRRLTGFPPQELSRRIAEEESFWPYRIWM
jgi:AraC-like DNA-binding protein